MQNRCRCYFVVMDIRLKHPFTCTISGPSGSGKTQWVFKLLKHMCEMIMPTPSKVIYCYGEYQSKFDSYPFVHFHEGLPSLDMFDGSPTLLVLDDLMAETDDTVTNLFTKVSHHRSVSVIYLTQNIFYKNKQSRTISLNSHYLILFKSPRDAGQIAALGRQMYPGKSKFLVEAFRDATARPHSYLFVDLRPETDEKYRVRANIFPDEQQVVYVHK